jgi:MSHA pilin protein MshC
MKSLRRGSRYLYLKAGFTVVELIAVLVILGVLSAVAIPRFFNKSTSDLTGYFNQAQTIVRYGQKVAIAQGTNVYVQLNGSSVALCYGTSSCTTPVKAPSGSNSGSAVTLAACGNSNSWDCEGTPTGVAYSTAIAAFYFSPQGKPYHSTNPTDTEPISTFITPLVITFTGSSGATLSFDVEPETGYVHH